MDEIENSIFIKKQILFFRFLLIHYNAQEIIDTLHDYKAFLGFLAKVSITLDYDKEFFLLKDYLEKTQYAIRLGSEKFKTIGETRKEENEHIIALNKLLTVNYKDKIVDRYLGGEYLMREYVPYTDELLFSSMEHDYFALKAIQESLNASQNLYSNIGPRQFLASTSYFTYIMPELYENNPECITISKDHIKQLCKENPKLKIYAKKVKKRLDLFK